MAATNMKDADFKRHSYRSGGASRYVVVKNGASFINIAFLKKGRKT